MLFSRWQLSDILSWLFITMESQGDLMIFQCQPIPTCECFLDMAFPDEYDRVDSTAQTDLESNGVLQIAGVAAHLQLKLKGSHWPHFCFCFWQGPWLRSRCSSVTDVIPPETDPKDWTSKEELIPMNFRWSALYVARLKQKKASVWKNKTKRISNYRLGKSEWTERSRGWWHLAGAILTSL